MIVCFVDIFGIIDHHCLHFLFIIIQIQTFNGIAFKSLSDTKNDGINKTTSFKNSKSLICNEKYSDSRCHKTVSIIHIYDFEIITINLKWIYFQKPVVTDY